MPTYIILIYLHRNWIASTELNLIMLRLLLRDTTKTAMWNLLLHVPPPLKKCWGELVVAFLGILSEKKLYLENFVNNTVLVKTLFSAFKT